MSRKHLSDLIEKLFVILLAGTCGFGVSYLRDINTAMESIRGRVGDACEQVAAIDANVKMLGDRIAYFQVMIDAHESRLDKLSKHGG